MVMMILMQPILGKCSLFLCFVPASCERARFLRLSIAHRKMALFFPLSSLTCYSTHTHTHRGTLDFLRNSKEVVALRRREVKRFNAMSMADCCTVNYLLRKCTLVDGDFLATHLDEELKKASILGNKYKKHRHARGQRHT